MMIHSDIEKIFIETAGELAASFSLNRVVVQLYALLYINATPISLKELAEKLKISKGSASINIRILEEWNAVKKVFIQGTRKDFYTAEEDIFQIILNRTQTGLAKRLTLIQEKKKQLNFLLEQKNDKKRESKTDFYSERFKRLEEILDLAKMIHEYLPKVKQLKHYGNLFRR